MNERLTVCLIGDILVDVTLKNISTSYKLRLGGIVHAARGLWALGTDYSVGYFAPQYLDKDIHEFLKEYGCRSIVKLGNVSGSPYIILIDDAKEAGNQGYEFLLRNGISLDYNKKAWEDLLSQNFSDLFFISGNYNLPSLVDVIPNKTRLHIDFANNVKDVKILSGFEQIFSTLFISTSSDIFHDLFDGDFITYSRRFQPYTDRLILKENRGGSRGIDFRDNNLTNAPSQTQPIVHSVGVGDVYDVTFISHIQRVSLKESMVIASWIAAEYAVTTYPDDFKTSVSRIIKSTIMDLISLGGVQLPWEIRSKINIYIAAPDFNYMDRSPIDRLVACLEYHNFKPRRPILENGQTEETTTAREKRDIYVKDLKLLAECQMLIAVLLDNDPGTFIEIGLAAERGMPVIIYDPYQIGKNCMLTQIPDLISSNIDEIISVVFIYSSKLDNI